MKTKLFCVLAAVLGVPTSFATTIYTNQKPNPLAFADFRQIEAPRHLLASLVQSSVKESERWGLLWLANHAEADEYLKLDEIVHAFDVSKFPKDLTESVQSTKEFWGKNGVNPKCLSTSWRGVAAVVNWRSLKKQGTSFAAASKALSISTLAESQFRDLVSIADPAKDALSAQAFASIIAQNGVIEGWRLIEGLFLNGHLVARNSKEVLTSVLSGDAGAALVSDYDLLMALQDRSRQEIEFVNVSHPAYMAADCLLVVSPENADQSSFTKALRIFWSIPQQKRLAGLDRKASVTVHSLPFLPSSFLALQKTLLNKFQWPPKEQVRAVNEPAKISAFRFDPEFVGFLVNVVFVRQFANWKRLGEKTQDLQSNIARKTEMFSRSFLPRETELINIHQSWQKESTRENLAKRLTEGLKTIFGSETVLWKP